MTTRARSWLPVALATAVAAPLIVTGVAGAEETPTASPSATAGSSPTGSPSAAPSEVPPSSSPTPAPAVGVPTTLQLSASAARVRYGSPVDLTVRLADALGQPGPSGSTVVLYVGRRGTGTFAGLASVPVDAAGVARFRHVPQWDAVYAARYRGGQLLAPSASDNVWVTVAPVVGARLSTVTMPITSTAVLAGRRGPAMPGAAVFLQRYRPGAGWSVEQRTSQDATGSFRFSITPTATGTFPYRAVTTNPLVASVPSQLTVVPRVITSGMSGPDVLAVQRRLAALGYDVGSLSGVYGYDTRHAVTAFQKVQGLPRDGQVGARTSTALGRPVLPRLRYARAGIAVEVDLTRQVLYYARDGRVTRILDISSGNGETYTSRGVTSRAITPIGRFSVQRKIDGVRISHLGELYRPAYFTNTGYAIHGSPSVPPYPASHGCIRITNPSMDRLFRLLPIGTPVAVYRS